MQPSFQAFEAKYKAGESQVLWRREPADLETPVSLALKMTRAGADSFLLESVTGASARGRYSIIGWKPDLIWRCFGDKAEINRDAAHDRDAFKPAPRTKKFGAGALASLRAVLDESSITLPPELPASAAGLFGYLGYDMIRLVEKLPNVNPDRLGLPDALLIRPSVVAVIDNAYDTVSFVAPVRPTRGVSARAAYARAAERIQDAIDNLDRPARLAGEGAERPEAAPEPVSNTTPERYREMVEQAKDYIRAGDIFQVVPSQRWRFEFGLPPFTLYRALRRTNPSPYMFYFNFGGAFQLVGASPEIAVRVQTETTEGAPKRKVTVRPIAGTRPRGADAGEDLALERELLADPKELAEHLMLLDLGRNDVGVVSEIGSVDPNEQFTIERYSHVMHIVSNVDGVLREDKDALDALLAGIPAGTVSGAPKIRAMEIIDELETEKRGVYAGAIGYFSANGDIDNCIALRTAVVKDGAVYVQAGGGVVADSDPEAELQETINKAKAVIRAAEEAGRFSRRSNS
ncbi:MAG: anthranilate synthase component I [Neomegalonema sp.]|nr:anthranilate synthase component I [Neomegalonema sp.]